MIKMKKNDLSILQNWVTSSRDVCLCSAIEGHMGDVWCDREKSPQLIFIVVTDFCYILGKYNGLESEHKIQSLLEHARGKIIKVKDSEWVPVIESYDPKHFKRFNRYSTKKEASVFNKDKLNAYVRDVENDFEIKRIDAMLFEKIISNPFMADLCCFFPSKEAYNSNGFGYVIEHENQIVAGASTYSHCNGMIDITIGTVSDFRGKGLAKAVASKVILESIERNLI